MSLFPHARVPAVCLSAGGCASPPSPIPAPKPLSPLAVLAYFGLPLWALAGHKEVGRPFEGEVQSLPREPISLGCSSPAAMAIGLDQHCVLLQRNIGQLSCEIEDS